ncbi:Probable aspartyl protease At4g16563 [Linum grandiflorum]
MAASFIFLCFFTLFPLLTSSSQISFHLHHHQPNPPNLHLNLLANSSLSRSRHIKHPIQPSSSSGDGFAVKTQLTPHSYGGYSISLSFGTPPQTLPFVVDTSSSFVWSPCTTHYRCKNCSFPSPTTDIPSFLPVLSSSSKIVGCRNPKCSWIHGRSRRFDDHCGGDCGYRSNNPRRYCSQICPPYLVSYGSGTATGGIALSETLRLRNVTVSNFLIGCSVFSSKQPAGIAGLGRGRSSLASQLGVSKFSYCLLSHKFDDDSDQNSGFLVLESGSDSGSVSDRRKTRGMIYTPFVKNPVGVKGKPDYSVYYYVGLRRISVGGRHVEVPYRYLAPPDNNGRGGTIVDSGTTFTYMTRGVFDAVSSELVDQMGRNRSYVRSRAAEAASGLRPCFRVRGGQAAFPELRFHFKGGADMVFPTENYVAYVGSGEGSAACLAVVTEGVEGKGGSGPSVIIGNYQMQNFHVEFDLKKQRFGFKQEACSK